MAQARPLRNPPIQEAVMQFEFAGAELGRPELEILAAVYESIGWQKTEVHSFEATFSNAEGRPAVLKADGDFLGFIVSTPNGHDLVQLRSTQVSGSTRHYDSWEVLTTHAKRAFQEYVKVASPASVSRISARFINRIPPTPQLVTFDRILERPPLPIEGLPGAFVTDFLRRHVVAGLEAGFTANLTIGTVQKESGESSEGQALVIDTDVFKSCSIPPRFDLLQPELASLRSIKNELFFGSLKEAVVEKFE